MTSEQYIDAVQRLSMTIYPFGIISYSMSNQHMSLFNRYIYAVAVTIVIQRLITISSGGPLLRFMSKGIFFKYIITRLLHRRKVWVV